MLRKCIYLLEAKIWNSPTAEENGIWKKRTHASGVQAGQFVAMDRPCAKTLKSAYGGVQLQVSMDVGVAEEVIKK